MTEKDVTPFDVLADKEKDFDEQIAPLLNEIQDRCRVLGIPFLASFQYSNEKTCTSAILLPGCATEFRVAVGVIKGEIGVAVISASDLDEATKPTAKA